jgi:N-acetylglutamate synthase-like GNAT family acetyltransferase
MHTPILLTNKDIPAVHAYIAHEEEKLRQTRENYEKGCEGYGICKDGLLVCTAYTTATTRSGAVIVGVAIHPALSPERPCVHGDESSL